MALKPMETVTKDTRGIFAVWKPPGISSFSVIYRIRKITEEKKIGHAGTLDPLAEGILVIAVGRENTKQLFSKDFQNKEKEYIAIIELGAISTTDDLEGELTNTPNIKKPTEEMVGQALKELTGKILQKPPIFSALKINGVRSYKKAREGHDFKTKEREVDVKKIELLRYTWPEVEIKITTGPGVYIRSIARELGEKLKTGGHLKKLIRTRVANFTKRDALQLP